MQLNKKRDSMAQTPAANGRFGAMAALAPRERQCELGSYYPAGTVVVPRHCAKPLGRYLQCGESAVQKGNRFEKNVRPEKRLGKDNILKNLKNLRQKIRMSHLYNFRKNMGSTFVPCFIIKK